MPSVAVLAWLRLARVFQKVDRSSVAHLRCRGLSLAQFDVIAHVGAAEGMSQQELADALLVTKGNVCQLLDRLEDSGLILRRPDGRTNHIFLTETGRRIFDEAVPAHEELIAQLFRHLAPEEQRELLRLLRKLERSLA
jgi:DNA-binding MarR family transcriptional regulator